MSEYYLPPFMVPLCVIKTMYTLISPWPPQRNGIADYAYELTRSASSSIRLVTEAIQPERLEKRVAFLSPDDFEKSPSKRRIYHIGNNPDHVFIAPLFLKHPGIAVVHDVSLHYLAQKIDLEIPGFFKHTITSELPTYADRLFRVWRRGLKSVMDYTELTCLSWLASASAIIVHSRYAKGVVQRRLPNVPVYVIPHFAYLNSHSRPNKASRTAARTTLGLPDDAFILSTLGFVTRSKQYESVIQAIISLPKETRKNVIYVVAGEVRPEEYDLFSTVRTLGASFVHLMGFINQRQINKLLVASDLIVNLRYPTFGESSGSVARAHGAGAVLLLSNAGAFADIPSETCFHVRSGPHVSNEIAAIIHGCIEAPTLLEEKREATWAYAHSHLSPVRCASAYEEVIYAT